MAAKKIFIDSSVLYSFIDRSDSNHAQAARLLQQFSLQNLFIYTNYYAIQEVYTALAKHIGISVAIDFLDSISSSTIEILFPQKSDLISAIKIVKLNRNKQIPFKEAVTATLMQKKGISQIATFTYWHNLLGTESYFAKSG